MNEEEIIKKRLLIDGDGTGDDRRLNVLLKQFLKWMHSKNESAESNQSVYDRLMAQFALCEFDAIKTERTTKMIEDELKNYQKISESINQSIEATKEEIENSKQELLVAKQIRKNRMEYDQLARVIKEQPDRKQTQKQIEGLERELADLMEKKLKLQRKFQKRQKDFSVLMYAIRELECQLAEDSDDEECDGADENKLATNAEMLVEQKAQGAVLDSGPIKSSTIMMDSLSDEDIDIDSPLPPSSITPNVQNFGHHKDTQQGEIASDYAHHADDEEKNGREPMHIDEDAILELSIEKDDG